MNRSSRSIACPCAVLQHEGILWPDRPTLELTTQSQAKTAPEWGHTAVVDFKESGEKGRAQPRIRRSTGASVCRLQRGENMPRVLWMSRQKDYGSSPVTKPNQIKLGYVTRVTN
jgi:hypothetical protein